MTALPPREAVVHGCRLASEREDAAALATLLHPDVVAVTDGGGDVIAPAVELRGRDEVVPELLANLAMRTGARVSEQQVNGAPALVVRRASRVVAIVSFGIDDGYVTRVWITRSPGKLRRWNSPG
jgi:RNA polymerase sigma-70 factor (ECF subfamily)